jgi:hypothetical protein
VSVIYRQQSLIDIEHSVKYLNTDNLKVKTLRNKTCLEKIFRTSPSGSSSSSIINMWRDIYETVHNLITTLRLLTPLF